MSVKIFPKTHDGDQISVTFRHAEEKNAFESAVAAIRNHIQSPRSKKKKKNGVEVFSDFRLATTLQAEVLQDNTYRAAAKKILGIYLLNLSGRDDVTIVRYVSKK